MRVAITGASGLVGRCLRESLEQDGHTVQRLVRRPPGAGEVHWSVTDNTIDADALEGVDAVVHLAGESVAQRWNPAVKARILASRRDGTQLLSGALASLKAPPKVLVSASAVGFFGDGGDQILTEQDPCGTGFLAEVGAAWEHATAAAEQAGIRVVRLRVGIVMSTAGGALKEMLPAFKLGAGGPLGSGRQWVSWVALDDLVRAIRFVIELQTIHGPVHAVAPHPVQQRDLARALGAALRRPALVPAPAFGIRLLFGEMGQAMLLEGQRCRPAVLEEAGFEWHHPRLEPLLLDLLGKPDRKPTG